jgi:hypothetical protein
MNALRQYLHELYGSAIDTMDDGELTQFIIFRDIWMRQSGTDMMQCLARKGIGVPGKAIAFDSPNSLMNVWEDRKREQASQS